MSGYCGGRFCGGGDAYEGFREMVWGCDVGSDGVWCVWQASMTPEERAATLVSVGERAWHVSGECVRKGGDGCGECGCGGGRRRCRQRSKQQHWHACRQGIVQRHW